MVRADKAANNVVVVSRLHYINTLKQELIGTKAYEEKSIDEKSVVYSHSNEIPNKFAVGVKERQERLPTMYLLPKPHKRLYKAKFIANSSSCITTEFSNLIGSKAYEETSIDEKSLVIATQMKYLISLL